LHEIPTLRVNDEHLSSFKESLVPVDRLLTDAVPCVLDSIEQKANGCQVKHIGYKTENVHF
jgi:hypothetical protein